MKIIYNIPNIIRMAGMERILAIKANYLAGLTGMEDRKSTRLNSSHN